ncbi:hypothetical protein ACVWXL_005579 [Bradyrhizobium sp. GM22.5]
MKKYLGITKFQLGRLYRIESCTALTTALSGQGSRPNAPGARQHHQQVSFRQQFFAPQHGFLGKISLANFSTRTNLRVGRIRPNSRKWRAENGLESPEDRRSALWHGNQHVCERHPQVSGGEFAFCAGGSFGHDACPEDRICVCVRSTSRHCLQETDHASRRRPGRAAAGGGVPQWNCGCEGCRTARDNGQELQRTQASVAFSGDGEHWFLINASPDLRQQLNATPQLHPKAGALRHTPIAGVILTNSEVDAVAGLLSMREGSPFTVYAHEKVLAILKANSIFNVLNEKNVQRLPVDINEPFEPRLPDGARSGLEVLPFAVSGKSAWYLEGKTRIRAATAAKAIRWG